MNTDRVLRMWLWTIAAFIFLMVVVGGATRLTESGLSITEWKPIHGVIPPLSDAEWLEEFAKYKQIPEYQQINRGMSLDEFKFIFWWEWSHRLLGRLIGFVFLLPFLWFVFTGRVRRPMIPKLAGLFLLGGLQGVIGWWMVASGLSERTDVSQYRLAVHLTLACIIFAATIWIAEDFRRARPLLMERHSLRRLSRVILVVVLVQIFAGGLVAGLNAGLIYNSWPLMDGALVPEGLFIQSPWWVNFFENHMTVQFMHRMGAYILFLLVLFNLVLAIRRAIDRATVRWAAVLFGLVLLQGVIGIATLLLVVPLDLALTHQAMAVVVLAAATMNVRRLAFFPRQMAARA